MSLPGSNGETIHKVYKSIPIQIGTHWICPMCDASFQMSEKYENFVSSIKHHLKLHTGKDSWPEMYQFFYMRNGNRVELPKQCIMKWMETNRNDSIEMFHMKWKEGNRPGDDLMVELRAMKSKVDEERIDLTRAIVESVEYEKGKRTGEMTNALVDIIPNRSPTKSLAEQTFCFVLMMLFHVPDASAMTTFNEAKKKVTENKKHTKGVLHTLCPYLYNIWFTSEEYSKLENYVRTVNVGFDDLFIMRSPARQIMALQSLVELLLTKKGKKGRTKREVLLIKLYNKWIEERWTSSGKQPATMLRDDFGEIIETLATDASVKVRRHVLRLLQSMAEKLETPEETTGSWIETQLKTLEADRELADEAQTVLDDSKSRADLMRRRPDAIKLPTEAVDVPSTSTR